MSKYTKAERKWLDERAGQSRAATFFLADGRYIEPDFHYDEAEKALAESIKRYGPLEPEPLEGLGVVGAEFRRLKQCCRISTPKARA